MIQKFARFGAACAAGALAIGAMSAPAAAQERVAVNVGNVTSTQSCTYFRNYSGSRLTYSEAQYARWWGAAAARRYYASHTTWRSWVVKDCQSNFQTLRNSVEGALASTGRLTTGPGGYTLDITISDIGETAPARNTPVSGENSYKTSWGNAVVTFSFTLRDSAGSAIDGGVHTKRVEMSRTLDTNRVRTRTSEPGESVYDLIQQEVALNIAREVVFGFDPLRVVAVEDQYVEVNYGRPLLELGTRIDVKKTRGVGSIRYRVISASDNDATAEVDGDNDASDIEPGNVATLIESDSDAANSRRFRRKRLP